MHSKIRNSVIIILIVTIAGLAIVFKPITNRHQGFHQLVSDQQNLSEISTSPGLRGGSHLVCRCKPTRLSKRSLGETPKWPAQNFKRRTYPSPPLTGRTPGKANRGNGGGCKQLDIVRG